MKKQNEKTMTKPMPIEQARSIIENYFGINHYKIDTIDYTGGALIATIQYYDFQPEKVVRDYLEKQIPYLNATLYRDISEAGMMKFISKAWNEAEDFQFLYNGEIHSYDFHDMIASWLQDKVV